MTPIPFAKPLTDSREQQAVQSVLESGQFVHGPKTEEFEKQFAQRVGTQYAVALSSCTAALHLSLMQLGISQGDKVIVPAMTHVATAHAVSLCQATPLFVDVSPLSGNINTHILETLNDPSIKAIIPVHYLGLPCDMEVISHIASLKNWHIIEDCALALDASFHEQNVGTFGIAGCFSFYPTKHITSIEGGMLTTNDPEFAEKIRKARAFGYDKSLNERKTPGLYNIKSLGLNCRMDEVRAAVGLVQLEKLDAFQQTRNVNFSILKKGLQHISNIHSFPNTLGKSLSSHYCFNIVIPDSSPREPIMNALKEAGIGFSVHYPQALPLSEYYQKKFQHKIEDFPVAHWLAHHSISLPVGPHLRPNDPEYIVQTLTPILERTSP